MRQPGVGPWPRMHARLNAPALSPQCRDALSKQGFLGEEPQQGAVAARVARAFSKIVQMATKRFSPLRA